MVNDKDDDDDTELINYCTFVLYIYIFALLFKIFRYITVSNIIIANLCLTNAPGLHSAGAFRHIVACNPLMQLTLINFSGSFDFPYVFQLYPH